MEGQDPVRDDTPSAPPDHATRTACRSCGSNRLENLFSLGHQYVSDFVSGNAINSGPVVPIELAQCRDCTLVQQLHTARQDFLYTRYYWYRSGVTETMRAALADVVRCASREVALQEGDVVLDIGSNDGTLLSFFPRSLVRVGVEPADNLAVRANYADKGIQLIHSFWDYARYEGMMDRPARVVTAIGMMYDLEDPNPFVSDVARVLHPDGVFVAQLMCLRNMLDSNDVGNLCHEHLEFYTLKSLVSLYARHGLEIYNVEMNGVNGGSYRIYARHAGGKAVGRGAVNPWLEITMDEERDLQLDNPFSIVGWLKRMKNNRDNMMDFVRREHKEGRRFWVYGASTKGNVILQWYGLDRSLVEGAADKSPEKHGLYTPGTGIPIFSEETFRKSRPDYAVVLPYAFLQEFVAREKDWRAGGGRFVVPLPEFRLV